MTLTLLGLELTATPMRTEKIVDRQVRKLQVIDVGPGLKQNWQLL